MTEGQASATLMAHGARYVTTKGRVQWWKAQDGSWIAKTSDEAGVKLQKLPASSCNCG